MRDIGCHISNAVSASPVGEYYSTNLNPKIKSANLLAERIAMTLGYPQINIEVHSNQVLDNIAISCEMFSKFAGYTEEFLLFDSRLCDMGRGLQIDKLFSITPQLDDNISLSAFDMSLIGQKVSYDYDIDDHRKVIDVFAFEEGSSTGINTLFTLEQTMAQQTYFSYALGKYGFDLVSWHVMKNWLDVRSKLLSQDYYFKFDDRLQRLYMTPDPARRNHAHSFYGLVGCYVERPVRDLVKEQWVYQYALALTKINLGRIRGKYQGTALFGGGSPNVDVLQEGITEKTALEEKLYVGGTPGLGDAAPPQFFVG